MAEVNKENKFKKTMKAVFNIKYIRPGFLAIIAILTVLALVMVILGNIAYWHYHNFDFFYSEEGMGSFVTATALSVLIGSLLFVFSGFGGYGSLKYSTCAVNTYATILSIMFKVELITLGLVKSFGTEAMWIGFSIPVRGIIDPEIRSQVDYIQSSLKCCGNANYADYLNMEYPKEMATIKATVGERTLELPASCCAVPTAAGGDCPMTWLDGCKYTLLSTLEHNLHRVGVIIICVMVFNLLGTIFAFILARLIRNMKTEEAVTAWTVTEEAIVARQAEESNRSEQTDHINLEHPTSSEV